MVAGGSLERGKVHVGLSKLKGFGSKFIKKAFEENVHEDAKMGDWEQEFNKNIGKP